MLLLVGPLPGPPAAPPIGSRSHCSLPPQVVVLTDASLEEAKRIDAFCHANGIAFIRAQARGVFASVFTDFGPSFTVFDQDGAWGHDVPWKAL